MDSLFASPGMIAVTMYIAIVSLLSFLLLRINIRIFRSHARKYQSLLKSFGNEDAWGSPGWFLIPLYSVATIIATIIIWLLFIFQPHLI